MSWEAVNWSVDQRTASAEAQVILMLLANVAGPDGRVAYVSAEYLAERGRQSRASVFRRLKEFEEVGIFSRHKYTTENGRKIHSGQLHLDRSIMIDCRKGRRGEPLGGELEEHEEDESESQTETVNAINESQPSRSESQTETVTPVNESQPRQKRVSPVRLQDNRISNQISPSLSSTCSDPEVLPEGEREIFDNLRVREEFQKLQVAYGANAGMDLARALKEFGKRPVKKREMMLRKAAVAREGRANSGRKHPKDLANWIADEDYELIADQEEGRALAAGLGGPLIFVKEGTDAWRVWQTYLRATRDRRLGLAEQSKTHNGTGWWFPTLFPPAIPAAQAKRA